LKGRAVSPLLAIIFSTATIGNERLKQRAENEMTGTKSKMLIAGCVLAMTLPASAAPGYHLVISVTLGGDTFWDCVYFDAANHHVFVTHGTHVVVVDSESYDVVGDIPDTPQVHGVAVADKLGKGFITSGANNSVVVFDPKTLKTTGTIAVGTRPDGIVYDPHSRRIFTFNAGSKDSTVIDVASGTVDGTVPLGGKPEFAVVDGAGHIFDNIEDKSEIAEIDTRTMDVIARWPLAPCESPSGLAFDKTHARLFAACENEMMAVVDAKSGKVITTVATGKGADGAGFDAKTRDVLIPNGEGKLSVIHQETVDRYHLVENAPTQFGVRTMDLDPATHRIFSATADLSPDPGKRPPYKMGPGSFRLVVFGK
jgi:YVTN family beta-propeller protein